MKEKGRKDEIEEYRKSEQHYRLLLDESMDPTFSFYSDGTYRYVNEAFAAGVGKPREEIVGKKIWDVFSKEEADRRFAVVRRVFASGKTEEIEVKVPLPSGDTYYLTTAKPILSAANTVETVICTSKNITKRKLAEDALKAEHAALVKALEEIKKLSGLLPICSHCKKIRDDKGYWKQLEAYISEHSDAEFSHGICPDCFKDLYPNLSPLED
jgi:PAS domain S-box-containing protein